MNDPRQQQRAGVGGGRCNVPYELFGQMDVFSNTRRGPFFRSNPLQYGTGVTRAEAEVVCIILYGYRSAFPHTRTRAYTMFL